MRDARGWYLHEKVRVVVGFCAFMALDAVARGVYAVTLHRLDIFRIGGKSNHGQTNRLWDFWIWLASQGYLYGDWRKADMPEHQRIRGHQQRRGRGMSYGWSNESHVYHRVSAPLGFRGWVKTCCGERWADHVSDTVPPLFACSCAAVVVQKKPEGKCSECQGPVWDGRAKRCKGCHMKYMASFARKGTRERRAKASLIAAIPLAERYNLPTNKGVNSARELAAG